MTRDWDGFIDHHAVTSFSIGGSTIFIVERQHFLWEFPVPAPRIGCIPGCRVQGKYYVALHWKTMRDFYDLQKEE